MQTEIVEIQHLRGDPLLHCGRCGRGFPECTVKVRFLCCGMFYSTWWCAECIEPVGSILTFPSEVHYTAKGGHTVFLLISQEDQEAGKEEALLVESLEQPVEPRIAERISGKPSVVTYPKPNDIAVIRCEGESGSTP